MTTKVKRNISLIDRLYDNLSEASIKNIKTLKECGAPKPLVTKLPSELTSTHHYYLEIKTDSDGNGYYKKSKYTGGTHIDDASFEITSPSGTTEYSGTVHVTGNSTKNWGPTEYDVEVDVGSFSTELFSNTDLIINFSTSPILPNTEVKVTLTVKY